MNTIKNILETIRPKSLFSRALVILGMPILLVQMVLGYIFVDRHTETILRQLSQNISGEISLTLDLLENTENVDKMLLRAKESLNINIQILDKKHLDTHGLYQKGWLYNHIDSALKTKISAPYFVFMTDDKINIQVESVRGVIEYEMTRKKLFSRTTPLVLIWTGFSSIVLLLIAAIFMRNQIRPIKRLAKAADCFGKGGDVANFRPEGATEVRLAGSAFIKMQERLNLLLTERTQMLAGVSHDLRTPLTRMKLQLSMMDSTKAKKELLEDLAQMQSMLEGFLNYARGSQQEERKLCDLIKLLEGVIKPYQTPTFKIDIIYVDKKDSNSLIFSLKGDLVKRLLTNLIVNSKVSGTCVHITVTQRERFLQFFVDDNGAGIPLSERENVFKPFYRLDTARHTQSGNVGLGLSIVRDAIRSHGGQVFLEDSPLGGIRVVLNLPV
ncbi:MAG: two-component sensor histidine kinase [Alphaproteobacteria bacterium CG_4_10_14_0_8_um_filter_37_21]|nr:MAG: two-component sensor histidine kinase [Alphaproteobacteria bacterium CG_4_10_14_0_8_um_filter_37_21]